jgi:hypothetical protein
LTITFLTLFFGLISGPSPVELAVDGPAAAVEISVDGKAAARLAAPPWKARVDVGRDLLPHRIEARALDGAGHELGRTTEWINLPHSTAKVEIALEREGDGPPKAARVLWTNLAGEELRAVSLTFDGVPVKLDGAGRGSLPAHDLRTVHVLTAQVDFKPETSVRRDVIYGGEYGSEVSTELTGVPIHARARRLPPAAQLAGWLAADGKPVAIDAVEEDGPGNLFIVGAASGQEVGQKLASKGRLGGDMHYELRLGSEDVIHLVPALAKRVESGGETSDLFQISPPLDYSMGGLFWVLLHSQIPSTSAPRIADAVASAGLAAVNGNRRRAVLLILSGEEKDASRYDVAQVRRFLAALRVPFFAWSLGEPRPGSTAAAWGAVDVTLVRHLYAAVTQVKDELDSQRIVMVGGRHLPQSITLTPAAREIELAGTAPAAPAP